MADRPAPRRRPLRQFEVRGTERLTPHLIRVVLHEQEPRGFATNGFTDSYVKLLFPLPGVEYPEPFDMEAIRANQPRADWPKTRTYTVRGWDADTGELTIDFVYHGDVGLAGPWAESARPGDVLRLMGPGGAYAPSAEADWHLLVGDDSALPAVAAALEALPAGVLAKVFLQVANEAAEQKLESAANVEITWLHREQGTGDVVAAVRDLEFLPGTVQAFVHGEAGFVMELRRHLRNERNVPKDLLSLSGYWRQGKDEDGWQAEKADTRRLEEASS
jgi:NADPH-dependent ferric siderophore reductase